MGMTTNEKGKRSKCPYNLSLSLSRFSLPFAFRSARSQVCSLRRVRAHCQSDLRQEPQGRPWLAAGLLYVVHRRHHSSAAAPSRPTGSNNPEWSRPLRPSLLSSSTMEGEAVGGGGRSRGGMGRISTAPV
jgi:hypothetical protein